MISSPERFYSRQSTIYVVRSARSPSKIFFAKLRSYHNCQGIGIFGILGVAEGVLGLG